MMRFRSDRAGTPRKRRSTRRASDKDLVVLCYHAVSEDWRSDLSVTPKQLEQHVRRMLDAGYRPATFSDAVMRERPTKTFSVTFDDAYASIGRLAKPILDRLGVKGTVFVPTAFPGRAEPLSWPGIEQWAQGPHAAELEPLGWDELSEMSSAGWEIGSHTRTHPRLTELEDRELLEELLESRRECERRLGVPCRAVAYPYGDYDSRVARAAATAGYATGATLPPPVAEISVLGWPRVGIYGADHRLRFRVKASRWMRRLRSSPFAGVITFASRLTSSPDEARRAGRGAGGLS